MKKWISIAAVTLAATVLAPTVVLLSTPRVDSEAVLPPSLEAPLPPTEEVPVPPALETPEVSTPVPPSEPIEPETPTPIVQYDNYMKCTGNSVNIRSGAGTSYSVLGAAEKGTTYFILEQTGGWVKTYYKNQVAYISAAYGAVLSMEKSDDERIESVIEEGYKLLGVPYVYGAVRLHDGNGKLLKNFTAQKFDCSSLIQYIFYKGADKLLQVNTRTQVKQGEYVPRSELRRGDCIFFTNESRQHLTGIERIGHVAIYLGDGYILHTASDYARIEKISSQRWNFYEEARRFI